MPRSNQNRSRSNSKSPDYRDRDRKQNNDNYQSYKRNDDRDDFNMKRDHGHRNSNSRSLRRSRSRSASKENRHHKGDKNYNRRDSRPRSGSKGRRIIFDFEIFLESYQAKLFSENNERLLKKIRDKVRVRKMYMDHNTSIPGFNGSILKIADENMRAKYDALLEVLYEIEDDRSSRRDGNSINILVPEGTVSLIIGSKGKYINTLMRDSRTQIIVNPAIHKMTFRMVKIEGKPRNIADACKMIYGTIEDISPNVEKLEKAPKPIDMLNVKITAKLVFPQEGVEYLIGKEDNWLGNLCEKCQVSIKFVQDRQVRCVKRDEAICVIQGKMTNVVSSIIVLLHKQDEFDRRNNHVFDMIKVLIPNCYVTKLIGAKGSMIREIAGRSGGAQIKIMSDKQAEKEQQDCVVTVAGTMINKQDAICCILEQIEIFKNGGPVLINGRAINDTLIQYFKTNNNQSEDLLKDFGLKRSDSGAKQNDGKNDDFNRATDLDKQLDEEINIIDDDRRSVSRESPRRSGSQNDNRRRLRSRSRDSDRRRKNNSVSRSRSRSLSKPRRENRNEYRSRSRNNKSRSHSPQRRSYDRDYKRKDSREYRRSPSRGRDHGTDKKDPSKNSHYIDSRGDVKISARIVVPNYLVPNLIGKKGDNIQDMERESDAKISFQREDSISDKMQINTAEGLRGRIVTITGAPRALEKAYGRIIREIVKWEEMINGTRHQERNHDK